MCPEWQWDTSVSREGCRLCGYHALIPSSLTHPLHQMAGFQLSNAASPQATTISDDSTKSLVAEWDATVVIDRNPISYEIGDLMKIESFPLPRAILPDIIQTDIEYPPSFLRKLLIYLYNEMMPGPLHGRIRLYSHLVIDTIVLRKSNFKRRSTLRGVRQGQDFITAMSDPDNELALIATFIMSSDEMYCVPN